MMKSCSLRRWIKTQCKLMIVYIYIYIIINSNKIIQVMKYIRVKAKYTLYSYDRNNERKHQQEQQMCCNGNNRLATVLLRDVEHSYYIIEKGKIEVHLDEKRFLLEREGTLSTKALVKNMKQSCSLITSKRVYIYQLPLTKYTSIFNEFIDKLIDEKVQALKSNYLFGNVDKKVLTKLANGCVKKTYTERTLLLEQEKLIDCIYIVASGVVSCEHNYEIVRTLTKGQVIGEMPLLTQIESFYSFYAEQGCILYQLSYQVIDSVICSGENSITSLLQNVFVNALKNSQVLSKYFNERNYNVIFDLFQLKYYFNDTITESKNVKIFIPLGGIILEKKEQSTNLLYPSNVFYEDELMYSNNNNLLLTCEECIVLEVQWIELLKNIKCFDEKNMSLCDKLLCIRNVRCLKGLNELQLFNIAESLHSCTFKENELIIKDGPISKKLFIIKHGEVKIYIKDIEIKRLTKGKSFGDIVTSQSGLYTIKASFYAKTNLECFYLNKEIYDEIIDSELLLKPFSKLLFKEITIALDQLFYIKKLGQGSYGNVYLVHNKNKLYAMKTAEVHAMVQNKDSAKFYLNEKSIMSSIEHPFIVNLIHTFKTREYIFFLIEYIKGKTLRDYLKEYKTKLRDIPETTFIAGILCNIITYLQKKRIIHRDLKPDNLMIDFTTGYIKAIDFGIAKDLSSKDTTNTVIGTAQYMSPEIVNGKNYSFSADVWAVGVILYEIFYGKQPFGSGLSDIQEIYQDIRDNKVIFPSDPKNECVNTFLGSLLEKNASKRMNKFCHWRSEMLFKEINLDMLIKMQVTSPLLANIHAFIDTAKVKNEIVVDAEQLSRVKIGEEEELKNTALPFHRFIKNNMRLDTTDEEAQLQRDDVFDYLAEF